MAAALLSQALSGGSGGARRGARAEQRAPRGVPQDMDHIELVPEDASGAVAKAFRSIRTHLGLGVVPDDFRALARWPKYLELAWREARERDEEPRAKSALRDLAAEADEAQRPLTGADHVRDDALEAPVAVAVGALDEAVACR